MVLFPKTHSLTLRKTLKKKKPVEGHSTIYLASTPQTVHATKNKESLRHSHSQEEPKERRSLNVILDDIRSRKRSLGKTKEI